MHHIKGSFRWVACWGGAVRLVRDAQRVHLPAAPPSRSLQVPYRAALWQGGSTGSPQGWQRGSGEGGSGAVGRGLLHESPPPGQDDGYLAMCIAVKGEPRQPGAPAACWLLPFTCCCCSSWCRRKLLAGVSGFGSWDSRAKRAGQFSTLFGWARLATSPSLCSALLSPPFPRKNNICADEHCDIREWVLHHASLGAAKFYIFDTQSEQPMGPVLEDLISTGLVEYHYVTSTTEELHLKQPGPGRSYNWQAGVYPLCLQRYGARHEWMGEWSRGRAGQEGVRGSVRCVCGTQFNAHG